MSCAILFFLINKQTKNTNSAIQGRMFCHLIAPFGFQKPCGYGLKVYSFTKVSLLNNQSELVEHECSVCESIILEMIILLMSQPRCCLEKFPTTLVLIEPSFDLLLRVLQNFFLSFYFLVFKALGGSTENLEQL